MFTIDSATSAVLQDSSADQLFDPSGVVQIRYDGYQGRAGNKLIVKDLILKGRLAVVPFMLKDGERIPIQKWKSEQIGGYEDDLTLLDSDDFDLERISADIHRYYDRPMGIYVVTGERSGDLEGLDFDWESEEHINRFRVDIGPDLYGRLVIVSTAKGYHVLYRSPAVEPNQVLAYRADPRVDDNPILVETRGCAGLLQFAGTPAGLHPSGREYRVVQGNLLAIPTITAEERRAIVLACRSYARWTPPPKATKVKREAEYESDDPTDTRPGTLFNCRGDWNDDVLEPAGYTQATETSWWRPGKAGGSTSVKLVPDTDLLHVFSTSVNGLLANETYTKFGAYVRLHHDGDFSSAAKALAEEGFKSDRKMKLADWLEVEERRSADVMVMEERLERMFGRDGPGDEKSPCEQPNGPEVSGTSLATERSAEEVDDLSEFTPPGGYRSPSTERSKAGPRPEKQTAAERCVSLAVQLAELWHTPDGEAWATILAGTMRANVPVAGSTFRSWVGHAHYSATGKVAGSEALKSAVGIVGHKAMAAEVRKLYHRVARVGDRLYLDMCRDGGECVEVDPFGWRVLTDPPVKFGRNPNMAPLPIPIRNGSVEPLREFVAAGEEFGLAVVFLLDALKGCGPYFTLAVTGERGTAKSYSCRTLKCVVDPTHKAVLASLPHDVEGFGVHGANDYVLGYDNVSKVEPWQSDVMCRIATGGGFRRRAMYENKEQVVYDVCAPMVLNGIPDFVEMSDLASRTITIRLQPIEPDARRDEASLDAAFRAAHPGILGGLLDMVSRGLASVDKTKVSKLPRMADSARWVVACCGDESLLELVNDNQTEGVDVALDASPLARILFKYLGDGTTLYGRSGEYRGTCEDLLDRLTNYAEVNRLRIPRTFPQTPRGVGTALRRDAPAMRAKGHTVEFVKSNGDRLVHVKLAAPAPTSPAAPAEETVPGEAWFKDLSEELTRIERGRKRA